jgi:lipid-binding SYLF domain-containing protein
MSNRLLTLFAAALLLTLPAVAKASDKEDDISRTQKSARIFHEIMDTPDKGIPKELMESAKCIAVIPGDVKFAFVFGANYGRGLATCRTERGWSAPIFLAMEGGSVGYQAGGSSTDLVLLFMNEHALQSLLGDKFKLGGEASVAAGPVGRKATASTDVRMHAEILSYSRSHGVFAGVSLDGSVVKADKSGDRAMYGENASRREILDGKIPVPESAHGFIHELDNYVK